MVGFSKNFMPQSETCGLNDVTGSFHELLSCIVRLGFEHDFYCYAATLRIWIALQDLPTLDEC